MAKTTNMYHVLYVEGCSPKIQKFKSKSDMNSFFKSFINKYGSLDDKGDNWVDHVFYGKKLNLIQIVKAKVRTDGQ